MGKPLPAQKAGYRLHGQFKAYLCHDKQVGKRPVRGGGKRPAAARCGRKLPKGRLLRAVDRALKPPRRAKMSRKDWLAGVEKWYNHAQGYFVQKGSSGGFVDGAGNRAAESPLRAHLKKYLGTEYPQKIKAVLRALETAFRTRPLTSKEYAEAVLDSQQRTAAIARAAQGYDAALARKAKTGRPARAIGAMETNRTWPESNASWTSAGNASIIT